MVDSSMDILSWLHKQVEAADGDLVREMVRTFAERLMNVFAIVSARPHPGGALKWTPLSRQLDGRL